MSAISTNPFATSFSATSPPPDLGADTSGRRPLPAAADSFAPVAFPNGDGSGMATGPAWPTGGSGESGASCGSSGFQSLMSGFIASIQHLLAGLGQSFGLGGASSTSPTNGAQTYFAHATAGSVGDPHESFDGRTGSGSAVNGKWDSMKSHGDLLRSDSFDGGYRVSTAVTAPDANGVTFNKSATVTTDGGDASVSMNADGSYDVRSAGNAVSLVTGKAVSLGNGETVTLNADKSLTVGDANATGGTIATTLRSNGDGGVDVSSTAQNIDLGGYLVDRGRNAGGDGDGDGPRRPQPDAVQTNATTASDGIYLG